MNNQVEPFPVLLLALFLTALTTITGIGSDLSADSGLPQNSDTIETMLADGQFVYGPNVGNFDLEAFLHEQQSLLINKATVIHDKASYYSINPRVLLALIEMQTGSVSGDVSSAELNNLFYPAEGKRFDEQLEDLAETLATLFYARLYSRQDTTNTIIILRDEESRTLSNDVNAATYALVGTLGPTVDALQFDLITTTSAQASFYQTYKRLFPNSDPLDNSNNIMAPTAPPSDLLKLPFSSGDSWIFSGGPHGDGGCNDYPYSSIDFSPNVPQCTIPTDRWITSPADADVFDVACGGCSVVLSFRNSGGWEGRFYHVANPAVNKGGFVAKDGRIGNPSQKPSCSGDCGSCDGSATGVHLHFALKFNGKYEDIEGAAFEGWVVHGTTCYEGYLEKGTTRIYTDESITSEWSNACCGCPNNIAGQKEFWTFSGLFGENSMYWIPAPVASHVMVNKILPTPPIMLQEDVVTGAWINTDEIKLDWLNSKNGNIAGFSYLWDRSPENVPDATIELSTETTSVVANVTEDGSWYFHLCTVDTAGNASESVHAGPFLVDTTPPTITISAVHHNWTNIPQIPPMTWTAKDEGELIGYHVYWGEDVEGISDTFVSTAEFTPGAIQTEDNAATFYLRVKAIDQAGNESNWQTVAIWHYDKLTPTGTLAVGTGSDVVRTLNIPLSITGHDEHSGVDQMRFSADGQSWSDWETYAPTKYWQLENHSNPQMVYLQLQDAAGNFSDPIFATVRAELQVELPASTNYRIGRSVMGMGGGVKTSNNYILNGTSGQSTGVGELQGSNYRVHSGFWHAESCTAAAAVVPEISISGNDVVLTWGSVTPGLTYNIYRDTQPYFTPGTPLATTGNSTWTDVGAAGDPLVNYYYIVRAQNACGESADSKRLGEFDFTLQPGN